MQFYFILLDSLEGLIRLLELGPVLWFETHARDHGANSQPVEEMPHFGEISILWLQLLRQLCPFNERWVLKFDVSSEPLLPTFSWIDHWIAVDFLLLSKVISCVVWIDHIDEIL